jgi:hypothetical protein
MSKVNACFLIALLSLSILIISLSNAQSAYAPTTWDSFQNLSNNAGDSFDPQIAASGSNVYLTWVDYASGLADIFFSESSDHGDLWTPHNIEVSATLAGSPRLAAPDYVYLIWYDDSLGNYDVFFRAGTTS